MITVHRKPGMAETRKYMDRLRALLLGMKDFLGNVLDGDGHPSATTAEEFYRLWGYLVTLKGQLEVELEKAAEYRDAVPVSTLF